MAEVVMQGQRSNVVYNYRMELENTPNYRVEPETGQTLNSTDRRLNASMVR